MVKHCIFAGNYYFAIIMPEINKKKSKRKWLLALLAFTLAGALFAWYLFTLEHADTADVKTDYTVNAIAFLSEFKNDLAAANKKYANKIVAIDGTVSQIEAADTTMNIKMIDTTDGASIIFAFQQQHLHEAKHLKVGDNVIIKGSCDNGIYSNILETQYITFSRCAINK
jgi:hypothetical protein